MSACASKTAAPIQIAGPSMPAVCIVCRTVFTRQPRSAIKRSAVRPAQAPARACASRKKNAQRKNKWMNSSGCFSLLLIKTRSITADDVPGLTRPHKMTSVGRTEPINLVWFRRRAVSSLGCVCSAWALIDSHE